MAFYECPNVKKSLVHKSKLITLFFISVEVRLHFINDDPNIKKYIIRILVVKVYFPLYRIFFFDFVIILMNKSAPVKL